MRRWLVTRHAGAVEWFSRQGYEFDRHVRHLDPSELVSGDIVYGNLPVYMIADLCVRNIEYWNLTVPVQHGNRGKEISADDLDRLGAIVEQFRCVRV